MGEAAVITPVAKMEIAGVVFPPAYAPPGSSKSLFLAGAGERGLEIAGKLVVFTAIGVYLEDAAPQSLAGKWKGKSADELAASTDFFRDIVTGPFEKSTRVAMVLPLSGQQYSEKVAENCVGAWKAAGVYTEAEAAAVDKFREALQDENFPPGSSILFTHSAAGSLIMALSKEQKSDAEAAGGSVVIESRALSEAILESIIGEHGVSPAAKRSLATRIAGLLGEEQHRGEGEEEEDAKAENLAVLATSAPGAVFTCAV